MFGSIATIHTIKAVFDWDTTGGTHNYLRARIKLSWYDCDYHEQITAWAYDGHVEINQTTDLAASFSVDIQQQGNNYPIDLSWFDMGFAGTYSLYVDGQKIDNPPTSIRPWRSEPVLKLSKSGLCPQGSTDYEMGDTSNTCGNIQWSALNDQITLSIIRGSQYVSFYNKENGQNAGKILTNLEKEINKYELRYDNPNTATTTDEKVILEATVNGISVKDTLVVYPQPNNFYVNAEIVNNIQKIVENEKLTIQAWLESDGICGGKVEPSANTTYTAKIIQGAGYGELINPANNSSGDSLTGIIAENDTITLNFYANESVPSSDQQIKVRISNSKENTQPTELSFNVGPSALIVTFEPSNLSPGDTANVVLKHRKDDGTLESFPTDQDYEVRLIEGRKYGTILSSNGVDTSGYFESVSEGFKFIAFSNIDTNNVEVRLKVSTFYFPTNSAQQGGNSSNTGVKKKISNIYLQNNKNTKSQKLNKNGNKNTDGIAFIEQIYGIGKATIGRQIVVQFEPAELNPGDTALVKIYKKDLNSNLVEFPADQKYEIGIMEGCEYGDLLVNDTSDVYFTNVTGPIKYVAADSIGADSGKVTLRVGIIPAVGTKIKQKGKSKKVNGITASYCSINAFVYDEYGTGSIVFKKGIKIELVGSIDQEPFIYWISQTPTMPTIQLRAVRTGFWNLTGETANWTCTLTYNYPPGSDTQTYNGETIFYDRDITEWNLNFNDSDPIIGGEAIITVTATVDGKQYADTIVVYIRGENPTPADVEARTEDHGQFTMVETESNVMQFHTENYAEPNEGLPLRSGADNGTGWGLCQLDQGSHPIYTSTLWDWTANLQQGLNYFNQQRDGAERRLNNDIHLHGPIAGQTRQSMIDYEGYAKYNGGPSAQVWEWVPPDEDNNIPGHWIRYVTTLQHGERLYNQSVDIHVGHYENNY